MPRLGMREELQCQIGFVLCFLATFGNWLPLVTSLRRTEKQNTNKQTKTDFLD
jgi:hypothetical protein